MNENFPNKLILSFVKTLIQNQPHPAEKSPVPPDPQPTNLKEKETRIHTGSFTITVRKCIYVQARQDYGGRVDGGGGDAGGVPHTKDSHQLV